MGSLIINLHATLSLMKNTISAFLICSSILIVGCNYSNKKLVTQKTDEQTKLFCSESMNGFQFTSPEGFNECGKDGRDTIFFKRKNNDAEEILLIHAKKIDILPEKYIKLKSQNNNLTIYDYQHRDCQIITRDNLLFDFCINFLEQPVDLNYPVRSDSLEKEFDDNQIIKMLLNMKIVPKEPLGETTSPASENFIECEDSILGVKFKYPENWSGCYVSPEIDERGEQNIRFEQMYDGKKAWLEGKLGKANKEQALNYHEKEFFSGRQGKLHDFGNLKIITNIACGGGVGCPRFSIDDELFFGSNWEINGEEEPPRYLMGAGWQPTNTFKEEDILNILKSVERVKE